MPLSPTPPERLQQTQELLREELRGNQVLPRNIAVAAELRADSYFEYHGVTYKVPPIPHKIGLQLQEVVLEVERLADLPENTETLRQLGQAYQLAVDLCWQASSPVNPVVRLFKRLGWISNHFNNVSGQEVTELVRFFCMCRTKSHVRPLGSLAFRPSLSS